MTCIGSRSHSAEPGMGGGGNMSDWDEELAWMVR
jgi:hypothetical protein